MTDLEKIELALLRLAMKLKGHPWNIPPSDLLERIAHQIIKDEMERKKNAQST